MLSLPWELGMSDGASDTRQSGIESSIERMEDEIESDPIEASVDQGIIEGLENIAIWDIIQSRSCQRWIDEITEDRWEESAPTASDERSLAAPAKEPENPMRLQQARKSRSRVDEVFAAAQVNSLRKAIREGSQDEVLRLLGTGADINSPMGNYGNALHFACDIRDENTTIVKILLEAGADVNGRGTGGDGALYAASEDRNVAVVQMLLDAGADVNAQGGLYANVLQAASISGSEHVVRMLLDAGADVNAQGGYYGNALQAASYPESEPIVRMLLDAGADVNARGGYYENALQAASWSGSEPIVRMLLDAGADVNAQGGEHGNALQAACYALREPVVRLLLCAGVDINSAGVFGNALEVATTGFILIAGRIENVEEDATALRAALRSRYEAVQRLLLDSRS
jgi:ankyrin repeat protein